MASWITRDIGSLCWLGQHSDLELARGTIVLVNLVVVHERIVLLFHI